MPLGDNDAFEYLVDERTQIKLLDMVGNLADCKGMITKITPPKITKETESDMRMGEGGKIERPTIFAPMNSTLEMKAISPSFCRKVWSAIAKTQTITVQITGKGQGRYSDEFGDLKVVMTGYVTEVPFYVMTAGEKSELEMMMTAKTLSYQVGGARLFFDPENQVFEIDGVNVWT